MIPQRPAKRLTDKDIDREVAKCGPQVKEEFDKSLGQLLHILETATEDSQEALAGFLFAYASVSNEIARRNNIR